MSDVPNTKPELQNFADMANQPSGSQRYLQYRLADMILRGEVKDGSTMKVDESDDKSVLQVP